MDLLGDALAQGDTDTMVEEIEALSTDERKRTYDHLLESGRNYLASRDYKSALVQYNSALLLDPKAAPVYSNAVVCFLKLNQLEAALAAAFSCVRYAKTWWKAYLRAGQVLEALGAQSDALEFYARGLHYEPGNIHLRRRAATLRDEQRKVLAAQEIAAQMSGPSMSASSFCDSRLKEMRSASCKDDTADNTSSSEEEKEAQEVANGDGHHHSYELTDAIRQNAKAEALERSASKSMPAFSIDQIARNDAGVRSLLFGDANKTTVKASKRESSTFNAPTYQVMARYMRLLGQCRSARYTRSLWTSLHAAYPELVAGLAGTEGPSIETSNARLDLFLGGGLGAGALLAAKCGTDVCIVQAQPVNLTTLAEVARTDMTLRCSPTSSRTARRVEMGRVSFIASVPESVVLSAVNTTETSKGNHANQPNLLPSQPMAIKGVPRAVDRVIAQNIDSGLLGRRLLPALAHVQNAQLRKAASRVFPTHASIHAFPIEWRLDNDEVPGVASQSFGNASKARSHGTGEVGDVLGTMRWSPGYNAVALGRQKQWKALSAPVDVFKFDLNQAAKIRPRLNKHVQVTATTSGTATHVAFWFTLYDGSSNSYGVDSGQMVDYCSLKVVASTAPNGKYDGPQALQHIPPQVVAMGDTIDLLASHNTVRAWFDLCVIGSSSSSNTNCHDVANSSSSSSSKGGEEKSEIMPGLVASVREDVIRAAKDAVRASAYKNAIAIASHAVRAHKLLSTSMDSTLQSQPHVRVLSVGNGSGTMPILANATGVEYVTGCEAQPHHISILRAQCAAIGVRTGRGAGRIRPLLAASPAHIETPAIHTGPYDILVVEPTSGFGLTYESGRLDELLIEARKRLLIRDKPIASKATTTTTTGAPTAAAVRVVPGGLSLHVQFGTIKTGQVAGIGLEAWDKTLISAANGGFTDDMSVDDLCFVALTERVTVFDIDLNAAATTTARASSLAPQQDKQVELRAIQNGEINSAVFTFTMHFAPGETLDSGDPRTHYCPAVRRVPLRLVSAGDVLTAICAHDGAQVWAEVPPSNPNIPAVPPKASPALEACARAASQLAQKLHGGLRRAPMEKYVAAEAALELATQAAAHGFEQEAAAEAALSLYRV